MARAVKAGRTGNSKSAPAPGEQSFGDRATRAAGGATGRVSVFGDEVYLWVLVILEVSIIAWLRASFSRYHGG